MVDEGWDVEGLAEAATNIDDFKGEMSKLGMKPGEIYKLKASLRPFLKV